MNLENVGKRIKSRRKEKNYTQEDLAEKIDVSPHYIYELERGSKTMSLPILEKLTLSLDTSCDYIIFGNRSKPFQPESDDELDLLVTDLSAEKRSALARIIKSLLQLLK